MSMYNSVAGYDYLADIVCAMIGVHPQCLPRYRDAYVDPDTPEAPLVIFTRTGGGNRKDYEEENQKMRELLPNFVKDYDDEFDPTFAHWHFGVPEEHKDNFEALMTFAKENNHEFIKPMDRFKREAEKIKVMDVEEFLKGREQETDPNEVKKT